MNFSKFIKNKKTLIVVASVALVAVVLGIHTIVSANIMSADSSQELTSTSNINPRYKEISERGSEALTQDTSGMAENTVTSSTPETKASTAGTAAGTTAGTTAATRATAGTTTQPRATNALQDIPFATAAAGNADYSVQWDLGYLIAIDNPDVSYACAKVTLTDEDRNLAERICMGEFGTGGFIGAALIAQCVKDAMCFEGYTSVADVISGNHYDGSVDIAPNEECRQAVRYIFDENHDAVQHRVLYMYNPYLVQSSFHESQNFILSYAGVRFFDRWG